MTDTDERPALTNEQRFLAAHACNARWALVKALVLNRIVELTPWLSSPASLRLMYQRDAVFAALVDMARAEEALLAAEQRFHALLPQWPPEVGLANPMGRGSTQRLAAYVEHLREQVEVLP